MNLKNKQFNCKAISIFILVYMFLSIALSVPTFIINLMERPNHTVEEETRSSPISGIHTLSTTAYEAEINTSREEDIDKPIQIIVPTSKKEDAKPISKAINNDKSDFSEQDVALLERVTMSESGNQPFDGKVAVAQTVINRLRTGKYGNTISDVVYARNQYSTQDNGKPNDDVIKAVQEAINNPPYPDNMLYFRQNHYHKWAVDYKPIGVHYFSLSK